MMLSAEPNGIAEDYGRSASALFDTSDAAGMIAPAATYRDDRLSREMTNRYFISVVYGRMADHTGVGRLCSTLAAHRESIHRPRRVRDDLTGASRNARRRSDLPEDDAY
jgi:hypothetical protein